MGCSPPMDAGLDKTEYSDVRCVHEAILHQTSTIFSPVDHTYALANIAFLDILTGASTDSVSLNLDAATAGFRNGQFPCNISFCEICHAELLLCSLLMVHQALQHLGDELVIFAQEMWEAAQPLFKRSEQKKQVVGIDERLQMLDKLVIIPKVELLTPQATLIGKDHWTLEDHENKACPVRGQLQMVSTHNPGSSELHSESNS
ncbi:hypothetical protein DFH08DRAFT_821693 [Mycena albidolilacea]|uniref:Uncharacterized protein n=1 Tax=Mycena albidolilacea TaxID=1033008 RepID=A0AAD7EDU5_9AGAR|nr:hypothetical protein DFH08DRAFT_821693 [Mycena albidolilacea]